MTPAELAELKRLRSVWCENLRSVPLDREGSYDDYALGLVRRADSLIAAAEECERLRGALRLATHRLETIRETHPTIALTADIIAFRAALEGTR